MVFFVISYGDVVVLDRVPGKVYGCAVFVSESDVL